MYQSQHIPVLVEEFLACFKPTVLDSFVDATLGAGGHAEAILEAHPEINHFIGIDGDPEALAAAKNRLKRFEKKLTLIQGNFRNIAHILKEEKVDGIFFDIGISSMQLDESEKGFSFARDAPLDMRKDPTLTLDAKTVVNTFSEEKLGMIFREYGEERRWYRAAKAIVEYRKKKKIETTFDLCKSLEKVLFRTGKTHPMTLIFQGLRIFVNDELKSLEEGILQGITCLKPMGRLGVISFHSLEDRIVKNIFRDAKMRKEVLILTKKPLTASRDEIKSNPRSRSAKFRFLEKNVVTVMRSPPGT